MYAPGEQTDDNWGKLVDELIAKLTDNYVFPDVARQMTEALGSHLLQRHYEGLSANELCDLLTEHLQEVSGDKHLRVRIHDAEQTGQAQEQAAKVEQRVIAQNYGFSKVERLPGNVGYIDLRSFVPAEMGGETLAHVMGFVAKTDALLIDLRENGGGVPSMVGLFCSYLLPADPIHLNSFYWRPSDETQQFWTLPYVPGSRYTGKPVYLLTSNKTFSGAEEFAYDLQVLKRAVIVGERTKGGAHPGMEYSLSDSIAVFIPSGRAINPVTGENWEGKGVQPDIDVPASDALASAYVLALKEIQATRTDLSEFQLSEIRSVLEALAVTRGGSSNAVIRSITLADAVPYLELCRHLDAETSFMLYERGERMTTAAEQEKQISDLLQTDNQMIFVADDQGQLVGHLQAFGGRVRRNRNTLYLVVGVMQAYAGQGVGTALFGAMEDWARGIRAHRLELTVMTHNESAVALYRKMGFEIEGTARDTLLVNGRYVSEYLMARIL